MIETPEHRPNDLDARINALDDRIDVVDEWIDCLHETKIDPARENIRELFERVLELENAVRALRYSNG